MTGRFTRRLRPGKLRRRLRKSRFRRRLWLRKGGLEKEAEAMSIQEENLCG